MATDAQTNNSTATRNSLYANFSNDAQSSTSVCPMKGNIAIFPVRAAIDESPLSRETNQGPHFRATVVGYPELETRSYTRRQLRDGWLYVWDKTNQTFHEYSIQGHLFTRHMWTSAELGKDERNNPQEAKPFIEYPRTSRLHIAYSPLQWTWGLCERMRTRMEQYTILLDLPRYYSTRDTNELVSNISPLSDLGAFVADITPSTPRELSNSQIQRQNGVGDFFTTTLGTESRTINGEAYPFKPVIHENDILGTCPERDSAIMVSITDAIAVLDDLLMNLTGRWAEQANFEETHQRKIDNALQCLQLSGIDLILDLIPKHIQENPEQFYLCIKDVAKVVTGRKTDEISDHSAAILGGLPTSVFYSAEGKALETVFSNWGFRPSYSDEMCDQWSDYSSYRGQIRFDEILTYLSERAAEQTRFKNHIDRSERDLRAFLDHLKKDPERVFLDPSSSEEHAKHLLERADATYQHLARSETGKEWIAKEYNSPASLMGLALFNFNEELSEAFTQIAEQFASEGGLKLDTSTVTSGATRANEISSVLDTDLVKNSEIYKNLTAPAQLAFETLRKVANNIAKDAWHNLAYHTLPALSAKFALRERILAHIITTTVIHVETTTTSIRLTRNLNYSKEFNAWWSKMVILQRRITGQERQAQFGQGAGQRSAQKDLNGTLYPARERLILERPIEITAVEIDISTNRVTEIHVNQRTLTTLGQSEILERIQTRLRTGVEDIGRAKAWVNRNLGGALPIIVAGLNIINLRDTIDKITLDGTLTADEIKALTSTTAYTISAVMALWVMPMWMKYASRTVVGIEKTLSQMSINAWRVAGQAEMTAIARRLTLNAAAMTGVAAIAAGVEAWQTWQEADKADNTTEKVLLYGKFGTLAIMGGVALLQTGALLLARWFAFSWVFGPVVNIILAVAGIAYLIITLLIALFKRNNLQKWLNYSYWGRENPNRWANTTEGFLQQTNTLHRILMEPAVQINSTRTLYTSSYGGAITRPNGFWLGVRLPIAVAGMQVKLNPIFIDQAWDFKTDGPVKLSNREYRALFNEESGVWVAPPEKEWQLPQYKPDNNTTIENVGYSAEDSYRIWHKWIDYYKDATALELEISYPQGILTDAQGNPNNQIVSYIFRVMIYENNTLAELKTDYFSNQRPEGVYLFDHRDTNRIITFNIPN